MKKNRVLNLLLVSMILPLAGCNGGNNNTNNTGSKGEDKSSPNKPVFVFDKEWEITSLDKSLKVNVYLSDNYVYYDVYKNDSCVVELSSLYLVTDGTSFESGVDYYDETDISTLSYTYNNISGSYSEVSTACNEITLTFVDLSDMLMDITFRVYDDGYAFKYGIRSVDDSSGKVTINEENTTFTLPEKAEAHSMEYDGGSNWYSYEEYYEKHSADKLEGLFISMPFLYETNDGVWSLITESNIIGSNYAGMFLRGIGDCQVKTEAAYGATMDFEVTYPFETPWRLGITGSLADVAESTLVEDVYDNVEYWKPDNYDSLSQEEKDIYNYDWVEPGLVAWDWLQYYGNRTQQDWDLHKEYIDLAVEMGWRYIILDGGWVPSTMEAISGFKDMMKYADERNIKVIGWGHSMNDFGNPGQLESTLDKWKNWGIDGIKIDFFDGQGANTIKYTECGEHQLTLQFYEKVYQECAKRQMVVNCHGSNKPTGERRIYPHVLNREGIRGNEMKTMNPRQLTSIPFLRGVVGPSDYTPTLHPLTDDTTIGLQLALHVLYESGLPSMAGKTAEYYNSIAKGFLQALPCTWDELKYVEGTPREDTVLARRKGTEWWVGGITVKSQTFEVDLSFLDPNEQYVANIYYDGYAEKGSINLNLQNKKENVTSNSKLSIEAPDGGGFAIRITKK